MASRNKIGDISYQRPNFKRFVTKRRRLIDRLSNEPSDNTIKLYELWNKLRDDWDYYLTITNIGVSAYSDDSFWENELDVLSSYTPEISRLDSEILELFLKRGRIGHLRKYAGSLAIKRLQASCINVEKAALELSESRSIQDWIEYRMGLRLKLGNSYHNVDDLSAMMSSKYRRERKKAYTALSDYFSDERLDHIMERLVHVRDEIAKSSDYSNYEELSESESFRDWGSKEAYVFKENVRKYIVPIVTSIQKNAKKKRLNVKKIENWDEYVNWKNGSPSLVINHDEIQKTFIDSIGEVYGDVGAKLAKNMQLRRLLDIGDRKNKEPGACCWLIDGTNDSYVMAKLTGDYDDTHTLFHEFGHALTFYMSGHHIIPELRKASRELIEIPSMTSELFANNVLDKFYGKNSKKIAGQHLAAMLILMCKVCVIDEWQRALYRNPFWKKEDRNAAWVSAEKIWTPWRTPMKNGWKSDWGIFETPFYDLDYAIAAVCSIEIWKDSLDDMESGVAKIMRICELGGTLTFKDAIAKVGIGDPFDSKTMRRVAKFVKAQLEDCNLYNVP